MTMEKKEISAQSITVNGARFPVFFMQDASMTEEAQEEYDIKVKTWRVETDIPVQENSIFTSDVVMAAFFSADIFDPADCISVPVCLLEKKIAAAKLLEAYRYDRQRYNPSPIFSHVLNGFLGCTAFLNLGFYLFGLATGIETRLLCTVYFVDKYYLDNDKDDDEDCDMSLENLWQYIGARMIS